MFGLLIFIALVYVMACIRSINLSNPDNNPRKLTPRLYACQAVVDAIMAGVTIYAIVHWI